MNYQETVAYIESLSPTLERPSLRRIEAFLSEIGSPQNAIKALHIGGTNGKGSTVAMLDSILRKGNLKVARFTGPHLLRWNERFHIDGKPISDSEFARRATALREASEKFGKNNPAIGPLTWFEFLTALAFIFFAEENVDVAVYEVGLGGRFDATNVIAEPMATGITNVSLDHMQILGETIEEIAFEKAGIIKAKTPVVTSAEPPALAIIQARAKELNAPCVDCHKSSAGEIQVDDHSSISCAEILLGTGDNRMRGSYQRDNVTVAIEMLKSAHFLKDRSYGGTLSLPAIREGLKDVYWPARFQILPRQGVILEGAHNLAGAKALRSSLDQTFPQEKMHFVFACYANKDGAAMLESLLRPGDIVYASQADFPRASYPKAALAKCAERLGARASIHDTIAEAFEEAEKRRQGSQQIVVTGSFATVKAVVTKLGWQTVEDGLKQI
ncbi:MAG: hypothetical protein C5B53_09005 [Candidatus Melainabacteria bacterium]|nr:MAG: hypothetical protein C5B53_09005 [Candidatus Melainabacteria bacterium]